MKDFTFDETQKVFQQLSLIIGEEYSNLEKAIKDIAASPDKISQCSSELLYEIMTLVDRYHLDETLFDDLDKISTSLGKNGLNYEQILRDLPLGLKNISAVGYSLYDDFESCYYDSFQIKFLVQKVDRIPQGKEEGLIRLLSQSGEEYVMNIIQKSDIHCHYENVLGLIRSPEALKIVLGRMADNQINNERTLQNLLYLSVLENDVELFQLIDAKSAIQQDYSESLEHATQWGGIEIVQELLACGANPNQVMEDGTHILDYVMLEVKGEEKQYPIIDILLGYGARISPDFYSVKGAHLYRNQDQSIINLLRKNRHYDHIQSCLPKLSEEVLDNAFQNDDVHLLKLLIKQGLDFHSEQDAKGYLLVQAVEKDKINIAKFLAKQKANVGDNPIIAISVMRNKPASNLIKALCDNGYAYNSKFVKRFDKSEVTPLIMAIQRHNVEAVNILLQYLSRDEINNSKTVYFDHSPEKERQERHILEEVMSFSGKEHKKRRDEIATLLIDNGLEVNPEQNPYFLLWASRKGLLNLVKTLHQRGYEINKELSAYRTLLSEAFKCGHEDVIKYLIENVEIIEDKSLLSKLIVEQTEVDRDVFREIAKKMININYAVFYQKTALHDAAFFQQKDFFDILVQEGIDASLCDMRGYNGYHLALMNDHPTIKNLDIAQANEDKYPFSIAEFNKIKSFLKDYIEEKDGNVGDFISLGGSLSACAAKLACLLTDIDDLKQYIEKYQGEGKEEVVKIIHDLTLFDFPQMENNHWDKDVWGKLAMEYGPDVSKYLFLAQNIESILGRAPENLQEIEQQARKVKYSRAIENNDMADVFSENLVPEYAFNRALDNYVPKHEENVPEIVIEGSKFGQDRFYMKKLDKDDLRGFILGNKTNCCQTIGKEGSDCVEHGMQSPNGGFYVVFKREKPGRVQNLDNWLKNLEQSSNETEFIKSLTEKATRNKYKGIIDHIKIDNIDASFDEIKSILQHDFHKEIEGEIVAQSWVWISKEKNLVLDSWERLREEDDILLKPFLKGLAEDVLKNEKINKIFIGAGGCTPKSFALNVVDQAEKPLDYNRYRDSTKQFLIAEKTQFVDNPIRFNDALVISNERIAAIKGQFDHNIQGEQGYYDYDDNGPNSSLEQLKICQKLVRNRHQEQMH